MLKYFLQVSLSQPLVNMKDTFASVYLFNYWYNVDAPFASAIEDREYIGF